LELILSILFIALLWLVKRNSRPVVEHLKPRSETPAPN
jgi:hypothetical protein